MNPPTACTRRPGASDTACRCSSECRDLANRARRERARRQRQGKGGRVPSGPVIEALRAAMAARNVTAVDYSKASGVSVATINDLLSGRAGSTVNATTAERLANAADSATTATDRTLVSGERCSIWIAHLMKRGFSRAEIAQQAGLSESSLMPSNLDQVYQDTETRVKTAARRLQVTLPPNRDPYFVPAFVIKRKVEALMVLGWTGTRLAVACETSRATLDRSSGKDMTLSSIDRRVDAVYRALRYRTGPSAVTAKRAREAGYAPWAAWPEGQMQRRDGRPDPRLVDDPEWAKAITLRWFSQEASRAS